MMDDPDRDGRINWKDARLLYEIIDDLHGRSWSEKYMGNVAGIKNARLWTVWICLRPRELGSVWRLAQ